MIAAIAPIGDQSMATDRAQADRATRVSRGEFTPSHVVDEWKCVTWASNIRAGASGLLVASDTGTRDAVGASQVNA